MLNPEIQNKIQQSIEAPTVDQMVELQRLGVVTAKEQEKLKESSSSDNAHFFLAKQIDGWNVSKVDEHPYYWSHRFTGRIARVGYRNWSMRIAESFWVQNEASLDEGFDQYHVNDGYRASYIFNWNKHKVIRAEKQIHTREVVDSAHDNKLVSDPDFGLVVAEGTLFMQHPKPITKEHINPREGIYPQDKELLIGQSLISQLSSGDCLVLAEGMQRFSEATLACH